MHQPYCLQAKTNLTGPIVLLVFGRPGGAAFAFAFPGIGTRRSRENDFLS